MKTITYGKTCKRCDYHWFARKEKPRQCPFCKSMKWNNQEKKFYAKGKKISEGEWLREAAEEKLNKK